MNTTIPFNPFPTRLFNNAEPIPGVTAKMILMTPALASALLQLNTHNRPLSQSTINKYTNEIKNGEWYGVASGVGISDRNVLMDGQHRLHAVVKSGVSIQMLVVTGLPTAGQEKVDRHTRRNFYGALMLSGISTNVRSVQTATFLTKLKGNNAPSDSDVKLILDNYAEAITEVTSLVGGRKQIGAAGVMGAFVLGYDIAPDLTVEFITKVLDPSELPRDDPRFQMNLWVNRPEHTKKGNGSDRQRMDYEITVGFLNAFYSNTPILRIRREKEIVGPLTPVMQPAPL